MADHDFLARNRQKCEHDPSARIRVREWCARRGVAVPAWAARRVMDRQPVKEHAAPPLPSVALDPRLSAWSRAGFGRGVRVHRKGVDLLTLGGWLLFTTTDAAIAALQL